MYELWRIKNLQNIYINFRVRKLVGTSEAEIVLPSCNGECGRQWCIYVRILNLVVLCGKSLGISFVLLVFEIVVLLKAVDE